jgi:hypothetical protein
MHTLWMRCGYCFNAESQKYVRLVHSGNMDREGMSLKEILDLAEMFHVLEFKDDGWSVVDWGVRGDAYVRDANRQAIHFLLMAPPAT